MGTVRVMGGFAALWAEAVKLCTFPRSIERFVAGASVIPDGVGKLVPGVELLQPTSADRRAKTAKDPANFIRTDRPMHPPRPVLFSGRARLVLGIFQCRGSPPFQQAADLPACRCEMHPEMVDDVQEVLLYL